MEQNQNTSLFQLNLDAQNSYTLRSVSSWARVLGIVNMIMGIMCIIAGILVQQTINKFDYSDYSTGGISNSTVGNIGLVMYVLIGLVMIISSIFALNASNKISNGLKGNDLASLNSGFAAVRNYFAFWAVLSILSLLFMIIGVLGNMSN